MCGKTLLFSVELYQAVDSFLVLFGITELPAKDLLKSRYHLLPGMVTTLLVTFLYETEYWWLFGLKVLQYFTLCSLELNQKPPKQRVMSRFTIDWYALAMLIAGFVHWLSTQTLRLVLETTLDVIVHAKLAYLLLARLNLLHTMAGLFLAFAYLFCSIRLLHGRHWKLSYKNQPQGVS